MHPILKSYISIKNMITQTFGRNCEISIHDFTQPESSVVYAANGTIVRNRNICNLKRKDNIELIRFMDEKGVFLVKGAMDKVAESLDLSKVTIYSYLDEVRGKKKIKDRGDESMEKVKPKMKYICSKCGMTTQVTTRKAKCDCGGLWKLDYKPPKFDLSLVDYDTWGIFRYRAFMPLEGENWREISLGEGMTPVIPLNEDVLLKMDYFMPTLSFKDRGAAVLIAHCKAIGVDSVVQDSSGNAGNSVAAYCAKAGIDCEIFVPEGTSPKKINMIKSHNARVNVVPGTRDNCADVCRAKVDAEGKYYANHVYNPFFYEGTKTYIYEVYEQMHRIPKNIFVPLGNGTLFIGIVKALEELLESAIIEKMPNIIAVQSEYCDPFAKAVLIGEKHPAKVTPKPTMAEGIAIGVPMRGDEILEYIYKYNIEIITAPENRIMEARTALAEKGIYCEHTTAATYAAYLKYCELNGKTSDCLIPMCGAGLKSDH